MFDERERGRWKGHTWAALIRSTWQLSDFFVATKLHQRMTCSVGCSCWQSLRTPASFDCFSFFPPYYYDVAWKAALKGVTGTRELWSKQYLMYWVRSSDINSTRSQATAMCSCLLAITACLSWFSSICWGISRRYNEILHHTYEAIVHLSRPLHVSIYYLF